MIDFINEFIGGDIANYPFIGACLGTMMAAVVIFMFYTIVASLFRFR